MTTSDVKKNMGPEYWVLSYSLGDGPPIVEHGFCTLNVAMRRLKTIQVKHFPSTIQKVELNQIFEDDMLDAAVKEELAFLDSEFTRAMGDPSK